MSLVRAVLSPRCTAVCCQTHVQAKTRAQVLAQRSARPQGFDTHPYGALRVVAACREQHHRTARISAPAESRVLRPLLHQELTVRRAPCQNEDAARSSIVAPITAAHDSAFGACQSWLRCHAPALVDQRHDSICVSTRAACSVRRLEPNLYHCYTVAALVWLLRVCSSPRACRS